jgi:hypothetical protein
MVPGVPRAAQQLVCVCANEFGDVKNCGLPHRKTRTPAGRERSGQKRFSTWRLEFRRQVTVNFKSDADSQPKQASSRPYCPPFELSATS